MKNKDSNLIIALKLALICFVAVVLLTLINFVIGPFIKENQKKRENESNKFLIPNGSKFIKKDFKSLRVDEQEDFYYFEVKDSADNTIGYITTSIENGYGGKMKIMTAFDNNLKILNVLLLDNNETLGLKKKALKQDFMNKFIGTNTISNPLPLNKDKLLQEDKDSITGATITFNGIINALSSTINLMKKDIRR